MIGIPIGLLYANAGEWLVHKYILHGLGKRKRSYWSFHWHEHHQTVRKEAMRDSNYEQTVFRWNGQGKEALGLIAAGLVHLPLFPVAPFFTGTYLYSLYNYYRVHKRAHLDPEWARQHVPWHYDHHMGPEQNRNWCVTRPWFDQLMGTRVPYVGTERERRDREAREAREARGER
jgi:sterol desaturase/sphingolipid hydroxylase (fatty acid hydroxylase superfamily)